VGLARAQDSREERTRRIRKQYEKFLVARLDKRERSLGRVAIGVLICLTGVLIPLGLFFIVRGLLGKNPIQAALHVELDFVDRAQAVMAYPLMVNSMLRHPGDEAAAGLVIISFDDGPPTTVEFMAGVCVAIGEAESSNADSEVARWARELMGDEDYQRSRRRRVPAELTKGHTVYACDLGIAPWYLPDRHLSDEIPMIPCLAEPGDTGRICAIPYWVAFDAPEPQWARGCKVAIF
jgi:hypothetical protein